MAGRRTRPNTVQWEVMHQLAVTGQPAANIAVLLGVEQLQIHCIERDEARITRLIALERGFWDYVTHDLLPPADGSESVKFALRCLYPDDHGPCVNFSQDAS